MKNFFKTSVLFLLFGLLHQQAAAQIVLDVNANSSSCGTNNGSVYLNVSGGSPNYDIVFYAESMLFI